MIPVRGDLGPDGFELIRESVPPSLVDEARRATDDIDVAGVRNPLEQFPELRRIAGHENIARLARSSLGPNARPVRTILFDKTPARNWPVAPHRDTTIAVNQRADVPGYGPWSEKDGASHCRPPRHILESMLTIRVALDRADEDSGALRVMPGSHRWAPEARVPTMSDARWRTLGNAQGDAVLMRPLLVHASRRARNPSRRRVLHLEWAGVELDHPLRWRDQ